jgi:excisionase family DNA binding protein
MSDPGVYKVEELASILRLGRRAMYEAIQRGEIPGVFRLGRSIRISRHAIDEWLHGTGHNGTKETQQTKGAPPLTLVEKTPNEEHRSASG